MLFKSFVYILVSVVLVGLFTSCDSDVQYEELVSGYLRKGTSSGSTEYEPTDVTGEDYDVDEIDEDGKSYPYVS
uniref:Immunoregulin TP3 n=1 Tax=Tabanus pleskei TaxID=632608 RepID=C1KBY8_9DIPT|nr:immunoregulin TP3 precursor [Tabanus pleskei]